MKNSGLEWAVAEAAIPGESQSGDSYIVEPFANGVLVAVIDGLGHGEPAAEASRIAGDFLRENAGENSIRLVQQCHVRLHKTRGVVMSLAKVSMVDETITWLGVGNVDGILFRSDQTQRPACEFLHASRGVLGARLPRLQAAVLPIGRGDTLIFVTDGIRSGFDEGLSLANSPQEIANRVLAKDNLETDDALVLVARFEGLK